MAEAEESLFLSEGEGEHNDEQQVLGNESTPAPTNFFEESIEEEGNRAYENALYYKPSEEKPNPCPPADDVPQHTQVSNAPYVSPYADDGAKSGYGRMTEEERVASLQYGDSTYGQRETSPQLPTPFSGEPGYGISPPAQSTITPLPASSTWQQEYRDPENPTPTDVCGIVTPEYAQPPNEPYQEVKSFACGRCLRLFVSKYLIRKHFPSCVRKYGNPKGLRWVDIVDFTRDPHLRLVQAPTPMGSNDHLLAQNVALQRRVEDLEAMKRSHDDLLAHNMALQRRVKDLEAMAKSDNDLRVENESLRFRVEQLEGIGQWGEETGEERDGTRDGHPDPKRRRV